MPTMGRSSTNANGDHGILSTQSEGEVALKVKAEEIDIKMEDVTLSVSTKLETTVVDAPKVKRRRPTFSHLPSAKEEALSTFTQIRESIYQYDDLGESQQEDVMACECKPMKAGMFSASPCFDSL
jgi:hypothetical protein